MAVKTAAMLSTGPSRTVLCPIYTDGGENFTPPADLPVSELSRELEDAGLIVVFGGDGTILRAARAPGLLSGAGGTDRRHRLCHQ